MSFFFFQYLSIQDGTRLTHMIVRSSAATLQQYLARYRVSQKNWVLPNWAFADPASIWGEILNEICGKSSCIMLWVGNFNAFIGRFVDTALGAYRVWKGALKNKRLHKNKWFLKIIQTGINPTTPDLTGSTGFVTKNHKYFSPLTSRICKCFIWQNSVFLDTLYKNSKKYPYFRQAIKVLPT